MILPLFVAICKIWFPGLTYGVYLVLFLKPGATSPLGCDIRAHRCCRDQSGRVTTFADCKVKSAGTP